MVFAPSDIGGVGMFDPRGDTFVLVFFTPATSGSNRFVGAALAGERVQVCACCDAAMKKMGLVTTRECIVS